jgi:hypothetical protein
VVPPNNDSPAEPVEVAYRYTPGLTTTVTFDNPAIYPPIAAIFSEALPTLPVNV